MMRLAAAVTIAVAVPLAAVQPPRPQVATKEMAVPFRTGETLEYDVGWSGIITAGHATLSVKEKKPSYGSTAYYIVAEGRPIPMLSKLYTLYYKADTLLDAYSLLPQRGSLYSEEGSRQRTKRTVFDRAAKKASYQVETRTVVTKEIAVPDRTQDALSAIYVLRSMPFKAGDTFNTSVSDNGQVYKVQMHAGQLEPVKTGLGTISGMKITPVISGPDKDSPRGLALWISDDARRLPLKIEAQLGAGKFSVTLRRVGGV